jgi:hypothetical protein
MSLLQAEQTEQAAPLSKFLVLFRGSTDTHKQEKITFLTQLLFAILQQFIKNEFYRRQVQAFYAA